MSKTGVRKEKIALLDNQINGLSVTVKEEDKKHSERNHKIILVWLATGLRDSEMCNFKVDWIEITNGQPFIHVKPNSSPFSFKPKYGSSRRIPINQNIYKIIVKHLAGRKNGYVFMPQSSKSYARFNPKYLIAMINNYFRLTKSIGRNLGTHTFRRTFASHLANSKPPVPLTKIQEYLGHKKLATTLGYLKNITTDDHSAILSTDYIMRLV